MGPSLRPLLSTLGPTERAILLASAIAQFVERVAVVAAAAAVARNGTGDAPAVAVGLGTAFLARAALTSHLRIRVRARLLLSLSTALLADTPDLAAPTTDDLELSLMDGLYAAEEILGLQVPQLAGDAAASLILAILIAFYLPGRLVVEGGLAIGIGALVAIVARRVTAGSSERAWRALIPAFADFTAAIHGRVEILANGNAPRFLETLSVRLDRWRSEAGAAGRTSFLAGRAPVVGAAVVVGLILLAEGGGTLGSLTEAAILASATPAFAGVGRGVLELTRALVRASGAVACLARTAPVARRGGVTAPDVARVSWNDVSFRYPGANEAALSGANVVWTKKELLGLAGQNGSGKSTFVRLLLGLHDPTGGTLHIGEANLADLDRASFRERVAYLVQRPYLPDRVGVAEAVRLVAPSASPDAVRTCLERLHLWATLVRHAPSAPLEVPVGTLSAGEKQRVAIARVLLRDAPLLLLDEPDANLDAEGIALVAKIVKEEAATRMVLVIAHSAALLATADRVLRFEGGGVRDAAPVARVRVDTPGDA